MVEGVPLFLNNPRGFNRASLQQRKARIESTRADQALLDQYVHTIGGALLLKGQAIRIIQKKEGHPDQRVLPNGGCDKRYPIVPANYTIESIDNDTGDQPLLTLGFPEHLVIMGKHGYARVGWIACMNEIREATKSEVEATYRIMTEQR